MTATNIQRITIKILIIAFISVYVLVLACDESKDYRACLKTEKTVYYENEEIVFENCSHYPKGITNARIDWSMGDGTIYEDIGFQTLTHKYELYGLYDVYLSVCPKGPCTTTHLTHITITVIEDTNE